MVNNKEDQNATGTSDSAKPLEDGSVIYCDAERRQCTTNCSRYQRCHPVAPEASASTTDLLQLPSHKASLSLTHNEHLNYYQTVAESIERGDHGYDDWVNEEQKQKAIATNDCWTIQWYPETPIGFCILTAADLGVLLKAACSQ